MLNEHNIGDSTAEKAKQGQSVFEQLHLQADKPEDQAQINTIIQSLHPD